MLLDGDRWTKVGGKGLTEGRRDNLRQSVVALHVRLARRPTVKVNSLA